MLFIPLLCVLVAWLDTDHGYGAGYFIVMG